MMKIFSVTLRQIRRSPYQAIAAVLLITLTFFVASLVFLISVGSATVLKYFESKPQITAFFKDNKQESDITGLKDKLSATGKVASIVYISKEQALAIYKEQNKDDPLLLEMVTADILPSSIEVSATDAKDLPVLAKVLEKEPDVEDVVYQKDVIEGLIRWTGAIRTIGLGIVAFLALLSLLVLLTITAMRITIRKEEIEIMRLIGASPAYIRLPFVFEGMIYGIFGGTVAWILTYILLLYINPFLTSFLSGISVRLPFSFLFSLAFLAGLNVAGAALGVFGSLIAVKRYLK